MRRLGVVGSRLGNEMEREVANVLILPELTDLEATVDAWQKCESSQIHWEE
jgi:hypothetical protein